MTTLARPMRASRNRVAAPKLWKAEGWIFFAMVLTLALLRSYSKLTYAESPDNSVVGQIVWGAMYAFSAYRLVALRDVAVAMARRSGALIAFLAITVLSAVWSVDPFATFKAAFELLGTTLVAWYVVARFPLAQFLNILAAAFAIICVLSLSLVYGSPARGRMDWGAGVFSGVFSDKNGLGAAMAITIVTIALLIPRADGRRRAALAVVLLLATWLLLGSNSVTAAFACIVAAAVILLALALRDRRYPLIVAGGFAFAAFALVLFGILGADSSVLFDSVGRNANLTGRTELWPPVLAAIADHPILGFGYEVFFSNDVRLKYLGDFLAELNWNPPHAHNSFLQIALDTGLVGLSAFVVVLGTTIKRGLESLRRRGDWIDVWPLAMVMYLIIGSYDETYFAIPNTIEWIVFVGALLYPIRHAAEDRTDEPVPTRMARSTP